MKALTYLAMVVQILDIISNKLEVNKSNRGKILIRIKKDNVKALHKAITKNGTCGMKQRDQRVIIFMDDINTIITDSLTPNEVSHYGVSIDRRVDNEFNSFYDDNTNFSFAHDNLYSDDLYYNM